MLCPSTYCFTSFFTPGHQKFQVTSSTVFYCSPCPFTGGISCYSLIISALSLLSFGTYTFLFLYIIPFTSLHSSSLDIFTPAHFISSTALITLSSFTFDLLTFFSRSTLSTIISTSIFLTSNHSSLTNVSFSLFLFMPTSQSSLLLRLSAFPILLLRTCFNVKLNLDRYKAYLACLQFNFCIFIKYSRFLWSIQISNLIIVFSRKYFYVSKHLTMVNISLLCIS